MRGTIPSDSSMLLDSWLRLHAVILWCILADRLNSIWKFKGGLILETCFFFPLRLYVHFNAELNTDLKQMEENGLTFELFSWS